MAMNKLKLKMQLVALAIFLILFGTIFITSINNSVPTQAADTAKEETAERFMEATTTSAEIAQTTVYIPETTMHQQDVANYVYYDVPMDDELQRYIQDLCKEYDFDRYDVVVALIQQESSFREDVISGTGDYGYMQINECNHNWLADELGLNDMLDGEQNIAAGIYILSDLYGKYGDIELALMAYNCGEKGASDLWQQGIYSTKYSEGVINIASTLEQREKG